MEKVDFDEVKRIALAHSRSLVSEIAPGGELQGKEWKCATVNGGKGGSCSINIDNGRWKDFATDEKGGDFISLWAAAYRVGQLEAAKQLASHLGIRGEKWQPGTPPPQKQIAHVQPETKLEPEYKFVPIPDTVKEPTFFDSQLGAPQAKWVYHDAQGNRLFYSVRHSNGEGKSFRTFSWDEISGGFVRKAWPNQRPLYGLRELETNPGANNVLIVEGEKAADAARKIVPSKLYNVVTWTGGSAAVSKTDWSPMYGKDILIWPDNDRHEVKSEIQAGKYGLAKGDILPLEAQPGMRAALSIAEILSAHCKVKYFSLDSVPLIGEIDGFDAADALGMDWDWETMKRVIKPLVKEHNPPIEIKENPYEKPIDSPWVSGSIFDEITNAGLTCTKDGKPHTNMDNVARMMRSHANLKERVWFDEFKLKLLTDWKTPIPVEWNDSDTLHLTSIFQGNFGMHMIRKETVYDGVRTYANENRKNSARDWMDDQVWDGTPRIEKFFSEVLGADYDQYTYAASKNFWVAMAARIYHPGCKMDNMVILEGKQGCGKSTALRKIAGDDWFTECNTQIGTKDFHMLLSGHLIIEVAELASLLKGSTDQEIKAVLSTQEDKFRPPYGGQVQSFKRTCVFVGTTNEDEYLNDATGARRYWPIRVAVHHDIELAEIEKNRSQLFAEAVSCYKNKVTWYEMPDVETKAVQSERNVTDPWQDEVKTWLNQGLYGPIKTTFIINDFLTSRLGADILEVKRTHHLQVGKIMKNLGYKPKTFRVAGSTEFEKRWVHKDFDKIAHR